MRQALLKKKKNTHRGELTMGAKRKRIFFWKLMAAPNSEGEDRNSGNRRNGPRANSAAPALASTTHIKRLGQCCRAARQALKTQFLEKGNSSKSAAGDNRQNADPYGRSAAEREKTS